MDEHQYLTFCGGQGLENKDILITLTPDIAFKLEVLAKRNEMDISEYIDFILSEHVDQHFQNNRNYFEKYFR